MAKIAIFSHGAPNTKSNQPNADVLMHAQELVKNNDNIVKIFFFKNELYQSDLKLKNIKKENTNIKFYYIYSKKNGTFEKFLNKILLKIFAGTFSNKLIKSKNRYLKKYKPDILINFFERAIEINHAEKFKQINFLSIPLNKVESLKRKVDKNMKIINFFNSLLFSLIYKFRIKKYTKNSLINFISCPQSYQYYKKLGIKNLIETTPLSRRKKRNLTEISSEKNILMIGNLNSTFMIDALEHIDKKLIDYLDKLREIYKFNLIIIGKFDEKKKLYKNLYSKEWIKFLGWVEDVDTFFEKSSLLLVPSIHKLSVRTKILDAFSSGLPVITYQSNIFNNKIFINNENIIICKNINEVISGIYNVFSNKEFVKKIKENSNKTYHKFFQTEKILKNNINNILNVIN